VALKAYRWHGPISDPRCESGWADCICAAKSKLDLANRLKQPIEFVGKLSEVGGSKAGLALSRPYTVFFLADNRSEGWLQAQEPPPPPPPADDEPPPQHGPSPFNTRRVYGQCERKKAYTTIGEAMRATRGRERDGVQGLSVYSCPHCGAFHLTKVPRKRPEEMVRTRRPA
jgi:hypothetical protein